MFKIIDLNFLSEQIQILNQDLSINNVLKGEKIIFYIKKSHTK